MTGSVTLTLVQQEMLQTLSTIEGADVWDYSDARTGRELEKLGLVRIVKARNAPANGALRQPYYGVKITAAGRKAVGV